MSGDIKQKLFDSLASTFNAVYSMAVGNSYDSSSNTVQQVSDDLPHCMGMDVQVYLANKSYQRPTIFKPFLSHVSI
jgi:hypothetical protein